jgi:formate hydrogenlyase subunit 3/multisubunit Na+/H+ antiporter MnhD subunit
MEQLGRTLLIVGGVLVLVGLFLAFGPKLPFRLGRLPLDIHIQRDNFSFYFPLGTCILVSVVLTLVFRVFSKR